MIFLWIFKKNKDKKQQKEKEDKKIRNKKNDDLGESEEDNISEPEVENERSGNPHRIPIITGPLRKKLVDKSYSPVTKEFIVESKKVIKQVNKNKKNK